MIDGTAGCAGGGKSLRAWIEANPEAFAALVAVLAIVGGLAGSLIGAKIQANGGRDQAAAAREAAQIAGESQRAAALWTVRQVQAAAYIQQAREVMRIGEPMFTHNDAAGGLSEQVHAATQDLGHRRAELELVATRAVVAAARATDGAVLRFADLALRAGPGVHAYRSLPPGAMDAGLAGALVEHWRASHSGSHSLRDLDEQRNARDRAEQRLRAITPPLPPARISAILDLYARTEDALLERHMLKQEVSRTLDLLIEAARSMLHSDHEGGTGVVSRP